MARNGCGAGTMPRNWNAHVAATTKYAANKRQALPPRTKRSMNTGASQAVIATLLRPLANNRTSAETSSQYHEVRSDALTRTDPLSAVLVACDADTVHSSDHFASGPRSELSMTLWISLSRPIQVLLAVEVHVNGVFILLVAVHPFNQEPDRSPVMRSGRPKPSTPTSSAARKLRLDLD